MTAPSTWNAGGLVRRAEENMRRAVVIGHVAFEDPGSLAPALAAAGFTIHAYQAGVDIIPWHEGLVCDLLVVLGGPIAVYEEAAFPFLKTEKELVAARLARGGVTLGICLGAQIMAAALGARVYAGNAGKEIGWEPVHPTPAGRATACLAPLFAPGVAVLHWHGDTFDLPVGAVHLASSSRYAHQIFSYGEHGWAFQCHPEVRGTDLERWLIGHACELGQAGMNIAALRAEMSLHAPALERAAASLWKKWLAARFG